MTDEKQRHIEGDGSARNKNSAEPPCREELQTTVEELRLVEEELRSQNSELEASREESERAKARYRELFHSAPDGYVVTDSEGNIQEANRTAARLFGCDVQELLRHKWMDLLPAGYRKSPKAFPRSAWEGLVLPLSGSPFWVSIRASASFDDDGKLTSIRWSIRDISDQKRAGERLKTQAAQLRELAAEITCAEQRERRRVARILHDHIQQLLVAAKMQTSILLNRQSSQDLESTAKLVYDTLSQTLSVSRNLTAELSPPVLYDIGLIPALQWLARTFMEQHRFQIEMHLDPSGEPKDENVRYFMFDAIRELLFNVIKHSGVMAARLEVTRSKVGRIQAVVSDTGKGFQSVPLHPSDSSSGLGLFSIQQRLQHMGGQLTVDSSPNRGTRVTIVGPLPPPDSTQDSAEQEQQGRTADPVIENRKDGKIRILLADDHNVMRRGLASLLRLEPDLEVVGEAENGAEALQLSRSLRPDVVIMDITMPMMNGIEATAEISRDLPATRVIGLSMHDEGEHSYAMLQAGAVGFVTKGGPPEALIAEIHKAAGL